MVGLHRHARRVNSAFTRDRTGGRSRAVASLDGRSAPVVGPPGSLSGILWVVDSDEAEPLLCDALPNHEKK